jgi:hypothetical protein
MVVEGEVALWV